MVDVRRQVDEQMVQIFGYEGSAFDPVKVRGVQQVQEIVELLAQYCDNRVHCDPAPHEYRDALYIAVMTNIADGTAEDPAAMTAAALKVEGLPFPRYFE